MIILGSMVFAYDVVAKLRYRVAASDATYQRDQPIARRVLGDEDYWAEDDD